MISYKLAKELKDAGFPQLGDGWWVDNDNDLWKVKLESKTLQFAYAPTLSELIEACGEQFWRVSAHEEPIKRGCWIAIAENGDAYIGSTLEEAVARLWLALNKK